MTGRQETTLPTVNSQCKIFTNPNFHMIFSSKMIKLLAFETMIMSCVTLPICSFHKNTYILIHIYIKTRLRVLGNKVSKKVTEFGLKITKPSVLCSSFLRGGKCVKM